MASSVRSVPAQSTRSISIHQQRPAAPCCSALLLLLLLPFMFSWLRSGSALHLAQEHLSAFPAPFDAHSSRNVSRFQELRKRYEDLLTRLPANQAGEDSNANLIPASQVQIPQSTGTKWPTDSDTWTRRPPAPGHPLGQPKGLPASSRLHLALLSLCPTESSSWDVTRPLQRQIGLGVSRAQPLRLHLTPPLSDRLLTVSPSARFRLELHWQLRAGRGRRSAHARAQDGCPFGKGRCCRLQSLRASLEDLGWADWMLAPRELDVRMCSGACPSQFWSANRHTQMLARLHRLNPEAVPASCCVPASYEPVVLLHRDSEGRVSLTPYDDLVANDCHCL